MGIRRNLVLGQWIAPDRLESLGYSTLAPKKTPWIGGKTNAD
jgi:hypothetical protein